jgi:hypothetical protein
MIRLDPMEMMGGSPLMPPQKPNIQPPGPAAPTPADPLTDFGPGNDLRYTQINPVDSPRVARLNDLVDQSAQKIGNAPDLTEAGLNQLAELRNRTSEDRRAGMQSIGRGAASLGRLGSGVTTSQLGDLEAVLQSRELAAQKGLAGDLTMQQAGDRRANAGVLSSLQDQIFGQGTQKRNELRGERGYQYGAAQDSQSRVIQARTLEEDLKNSAFNRNLASADLGLRSAGAYDAQAADSTTSAADLAQMLATFNALGRRLPTKTAPVAKAG